MALFDSPSTARELLGNIKLLAERDLLVRISMVYRDTTS
jgi:hypothetical protein